VALRYRKLVRDAIETALADPATGFNARLSSAAGVYGITPFSIDFTGAANNYARANINSADIELCELLSFPAACIYTGDANDTGDPRQWSFAGGVEAYLDFYVRDRSGVEPFDTESFLDAIEDAALSTLNVYSLAWPPGVAFTRETKIARDHLIPLGDGHGHRISISLPFEVRVL
jgi:hypothetical protein